MAEKKKRTAQRKERPVVMPLGVKAIRDFGFWFSAAANGGRLKGEESIIDVKAFVSKVDVVK